MGYKLGTAILCLTAAVVTSCASTRHIAPPTSPPPELGIGGISDELRVTLHHVIRPDGPGSWVQGAKWNEFVLSVKNRSASDVVVKRISLIDTQGVYVRSLGPQDDVLSAMRQLPSEALEKGMASNVLAGAAHFVPIPLFGTAVSGALMASQAGDALSSSKTMETIQTEFNARRMCRDELVTLQTCVELSGGASTRGSVFFPLVSEPQSLMVQYRTASGKTGQVSVALAVSSQSFPSTATAPAARTSSRKDNVSVASIQSLLARLGYDSGPTDGMLGSRTETAIKAFQKDAGLTVDGKPSPALLSALEARVRKDRANVQH